MSVFREVLDKNFEGLSLDFVDSLVMKENLWNYEDFIKQINSRQDGVITCNERFINVPLVQSSDYESVDSKDEICGEDNGISLFFKNDASAQITQGISKDSTDSVNINTINSKYLYSLTEQTDDFVSNLKCTNFEDGMSNDLIEEVNNYLEKNKFATLMWLNRIYSNYQKDADVLSSILRIVEMTMDEEDVDTLMPMVKAGLSDIQSKTQEAAIMVIERWRTRNCLDALESAPKFSSSWIEDYANKVKSELREELQ